MLWLHDRGALVVGVDPSILYNVPPGRHAIFVTGVELPEARKRFPRAMLGGFMLPVKIADPDCRVPAGQRFPFEQLDRAYRAGGKRTLWIQDP